MRKLPILLATALVLAVVGVAAAAIPAADGTFTACVKSDGTLRLIDAEARATCKANERTVTWSQTGPAGPRGPEGPQGPPGPSGGTGYELVYQDVHYDPVADPASNPWVFQRPISHVVDCPGSKKATDGGVVDVTPDPGTPSQTPSGEPMPQGGFVGNDDNVSKGPFDPTTVPQFNPSETAAYYLPSRPTQDGSGWVVVGFLNHPGFGESPDNDFQFYGTTVRFYATCVNA